MRTAILDSDQQNIAYLSDYIRSRYTHWTVSAYTKTFALATAVYDGYKGDVELLMVHVEGESGIELAKDLQDFNNKYQCGRLSGHRQAWYNFKEALIQSLLFQSVRRMCTDLQSNKGRCG